MAFRLNRCKINNNSYIIKFILFKSPKSYNNILRIFTSYYYNKFGQLEKSISYILSSGRLNSLYKKSSSFPVPDINFKIAITQIAKVYNQ